ncbi:hypothetical protein HBI09_032820 [Parastagonospora nodorum]|nr:hypothetical protein HBI09_032820 [Parastagonospora nodorum]KAH4201453.1 hypothetical protein HBH42_029640 [Parastagonospora nodorum]KAH4998800.1 hypothetical protein HBI77_183740 [Parastagonospora nodorum]
MVGLRKLLTEWIEDIPDAKLEGGIRDRGTMYSTRDLRIDCQETVRGEKASYNIQVQVNKGCTHTTLKLVKGKTMAFCFAPVVDPWTAEQIRTALKKSVTGFVIKNPGAQDTEKEEDKEEE